MDTRKTASKSLATVGLSSMLGFLAARIAGYTAGNIDFYVFIFLFGLFFANVIYLYLFDIIEDLFWSLVKKRSLRLRCLFGCCNDVSSKSSSLNSIV